MLQNKNSYFRVLLIGAFSLIVSHAYAENNHFGCVTDLGFAFTNCSVTNDTVSVPRFGIEALPIIAEFQIQVEYKCGLEPLKTSLYLSADGGGSQYPIKLASNEIINISGIGPIKLNDSAPEKTRSRQFGSACPLSITVISVSASESQKLIWNQNSFDHTSRLQLLSSIYSDRNIIMFWANGMESEPQKFGPLLIKFRDVIAKQVAQNPGNVVLAAKLAEIDNIIDNIPKSTIEAGYAQTKHEMIKELSTVNLLIEQMNKFDFVAPQSLLAAIQNAEKLMNSGGN